MNNTLRNIRYNWCKKLHPTKLFTYSPVTCKQGFTFAELMISLVVIAVITLILYPTISDLAPNNNEYLFKSAYKTIEMVTSDIMNTPNTSAMPNTQQDLCQAYCEKLNVTNVTGGGGSCTNCTAFITSNGMRWAFTVDAANKKGYILVDVNASNNTTASDLAIQTDDMVDNPVYVPGGAEPEKIPQAKQEKLTAPKPLPTAIDSTNGVFYTGNDTTQDTFLFEIDQNGKIVITNSVGVGHMQNPSN